MNSRVCSVVAAAVIALCGCAAFKSVEISKNYNKPAHRRVALLVARMGNRTYSGVSVVSYATNYAARIPKAQSAGSFSEDYIDVYIDDEARLKESLPQYPRYESAALSNIGSARKESMEYFANITPQVYDAVAGLLKEKGYEVSDVRELSKGWEKPFSEMTVGEIAARLKGTVDALAVFHYMDIGNSYLYAVTIEKKDVGFSGLAYTMSMFDVATGERLLFFRPLFATSIGVTMAADPEITTNPAYKGKYRLDTAVDTGWVRSTQQSSFSHSFSTDEIVGFVMRYLTRGFKAFSKETNQPIEWQGLAQVIP